MACPEYIFCTICGMSLCDDDCVVYSGPHWPHADYLSRRVSDQELTRYEAVASSQYGKATLSTGHVIQPPEVYDRHQNHDDVPDGVAPAKMYIAVHLACEDMAKRVMKISSSARIHSTGDLWLVLERRCASYLYRERLEGVLPRSATRFIPQIPDPETGERSFVGYYVPCHCLVCWGDDWEGWWDEDPVNIPNLTTELMSNLENEDLSHNSQSQILLKSSPNEIKNQICRIVQDGDLSHDCNYLMPQSMWAEVFFQIPFLWDLDTKVVYAKTGSSKDDLENWNWEKLTRQVMRRVKLSPDVAWSLDEDATWSYSNFGLNVPGGLANRRRIWQILEEMHLDVSLRRDADLHH